MLCIACLALGLALLAPQAPGTATVEATAPPPDQPPCHNRPQSSCGNVTVPLDRADPSAGTLDIGYQLTPARSGDPSQGTILAHDEHLPGPGPPEVSARPAAGTAR